MPIPGMDTRQIPRRPALPFAMAGPPRLRIAPEIAAAPDADPQRVPILVAAASAALGAGLEGWLAGSWLAARGLWTGVGEP